MAHLARLWLVDGRHLLVHEADHTHAPARLRYEPPSTDRPLFFPLYGTPTGHKGTHAHVPDALGWGGVVDDGCLEIVRAGAYGRLPTHLPLLASFLPLCSQVPLAPDSRSNDAKF
jgi:hypothetical protein